MKRWLVVGLLCGAVVMLCAFTLQNFGLSVNPAALPQITGISVSPSTFNVPSGGTAPFSGTLTAQCSVSPCPGTASFAIGATISVNNSTTGATVSPGASMTVTVSGGPANPADWMAICNVGPPTYSTCDGAGYFWAWVDNCTMTGTIPPAGISANTCTLTAPLANGSYAAEFLASGVYNTTLASAPFTVTGGTTPAITAVFVTPSTLLNGQTLSGSLIAQCSGNDVCPGIPTYNLSSSSPCGGQTNSNSLFNLAGRTLASNAAMSTNGSYYACVSVAMDGVSNTSAIIPVKVNVTGGGALSGSILPACPRSCTWVIAYNSDFTTETSFDYSHSEVDISHEWYIPRDTAGISESPGGIAACSQMIDTSTLPGYLSIHTTGTLGWEVPGALLCANVLNKGGAAGMMPGLSNCTRQAPGVQCVPLTGPAYYEYKLVGNPHMIHDAHLYTIDEPYGTGDNFIMYMMEARGDNTSVSGPLPILWQNNNHARQQGPYEGWLNGDPNPHVVGGLIDPNAGYSNFFDGTLTYPIPTQCTQGTCTPDPDNCAINGPTVCNANEPTAPTWLWDFGITSLCTPCSSGFVPGTAKLYFARAYIGLGGTGGGPPPPTPAVTVNGTSSGIMVAAGSNLTVVATNPPNNPTAWVGICDTATNPTGADCDTAGFSWDYLNCSRTAPSIPVNSTPCTLAAPSPATTTNYYVNLFTANGYTVAASAPFTVTGTGQTGGGACTPAGSPCPVGVAAPSGTHWAFQWSDEFTQDSSLNLANWNSDGQAPTCCDPTNGIAFQPLVGDYNTIGGNIRSAVDSQGHFKPLLSHGTPPVGSVYVEYYSKYPLAQGAQYYNYHPDIWYRAYDYDGISPTGYEDDLCEAGMGVWPVVPTIQCQNGIGQSSNVVQYECNCGVGYPPMYPDWHYLAMYWANDGSAHGTASVYWDGTLYSGPYTFQSPYWDNGLRMSISNDSCDSVHYTCDFSVITTYNPLFLRYVRVWYLVSN